MVALVTISTGFDLRSTVAHHFVDCSGGIVLHCYSRRTARQVALPVPLLQQWHHFQTCYDLHFFDSHLLQFEMEMNYQEHSMHISEDMVR